MTPKQKAIELVDKFIETNGNSFFAKQCALIAADEGEKYEKNVLVKFKLMPEDYKSDYWAEVKKEIDEL